MERTEFSVTKERLQRKANLYSSRRKRGRIFQPVFKKQQVGTLSAHKRHHIKHTWRVRAAKETD